MKTFEIEAKCKKKDGSKFTNVWYEVGESADKAKVNFIRWMWEKKRISVLSILECVEL